MVDDMGERIGKQGLGGMMGGVGWVGVVGGVYDGNVDRRDEWRRVVRNSLAFWRSPSRVSNVLSLQARVPGSRARDGSSSSSSEGKKSDEDWFFRVLDGDSDCESSHQLELFEVEMMVVQYVKV